MSSNSSEAGDEPSLARSAEARAKLVPRGGPRLTSGGAASWRVH
jgi:hypothetical protein